MLHSHAFFRLLPSSAPDFKEQLFGHTLVVGQCLCRSPFPLCDVFSQLLNRPSSVTLKKGKGSEYSDKHGKPPVLQLMPSARTAVKPVGTKAPALLLPLLRISRDNCSGTPGDVPGESRFQCATSSVTEQTLSCKTLKKKA